MNGRQFSFGTSGSPLTQLLSLLVFGAVVAVAVIMGAFVLLAFFGVALIAFIAFSVRAWWLGRRLRRSGAFDGPGESTAAQGTRYIEGEYEVVDADPDTSRRRSGPR